MCDSEQGAPLAMSPQADYEPRTNVSRISAYSTVESDKEAFSRGAYVL